MLETRTRADGSRRRTFLCGNLHKFHSVERIEEAKRGGSRKQKETYEETPSAKRV